MFEARRDVAGRLIAPGLGALVYNACTRISFVKDARLRSPPRFQVYKPAEWLAGAEDKLKTWLAGAEQLEAPRH